MSARNRVTPFSDIVAVPLRGLFRGNRGCLHKGGELVRAAGHRPCAECRRRRYNEFRRAWGGSPSADEMDAQLHRERLGDYVEAAWASLPNGTFVLHDESPALIVGDDVVPWTTAGYGAPEPEVASAAETEADDAFRMDSDERFHAFRAF